MSSVFVESVSPKKLEPIECSRLGLLSRQLSKRAKGPDVWEFGLSSVCFDSCRRVEGIFGGAMLSKNSESAFPFSRIRGER